MRVELDHSRAIEHLFDPKNVFPFLLRDCDRLLHFLANLFRVGRACAKDNGKFLIHELDRADEMNDSFLTRDSPDEKEIRIFWIDSVPFERASPADFAVFLQVDPVVNHVNTFWIDIEQSLDVRFGFIRDGDDRIRHFEGRFLYPE